MTMTIISKTMKSDQALRIGRLARRQTSEAQQHGRAVTQRTSRPGRRRQIFPEAGRSQAGE